MNHDEHIMDQGDLDDLMARIQRVVHEIAAAYKPGHFIKTYKSLFHMMDPWGLSAMPDCRIMPFVQAHIQDHYIRAAIAKMWPSEMKAVEERAKQVLPIWRNFCEGNTGNPRKIPYDVAGTDWPTLMVACPLLNDDNTCAIAWRRPSGCLGENPQFLSISQGLDKHVLKKETPLCTPILDIVVSSCGDPSGSHRLILPLR